MGGLLISHIRHFTIADYNFLDEQAITLMIKPKLLIYQP